jgi:hypothetical protein
MTAIAVLMLAALGGTAAAADLQPHSARYTVNQAPTVPKGIRLTGSLTLELRRTCTHWETSWLAAYTLDKGRAGREQYEEVLSTRETNDGKTLEYQSRYRVGSRTTTADGQARFGSDTEDGILVVKPSGLAPDSRLQPGTLPPAALRANLIGKLAGGRGPWDMRGMELLRFHRSTDYKFESVAAPPTAAPVPAAAKGPAVVDPHNLLKVRSWAVKQTSYQIAEWAEMSMLLHANGLISRFNLKREGLDVIVAVAEVTAFPTPKCN